MRFAVSMLTLLGISSVIGTVLKQNQVYEDYIIKFGQFWFQCFEKIGLFDVYHSLWFVIILLFLVISTSLCVSRNTPMMLKELKTYKEGATEKSLRAFEYKNSYSTAQDTATVKQKLLAFLAAKGFSYKLKPQPDGSELIAAKAGTYQRLGYILTHTAIVIICFGGLLDGNLPLKLQELLGNKKIETLDLPETQVAKISRLPSNNGSFRANMTLSEGSADNVAFVRIRDGYLVQELPFTIALTDFRMEHYATGQPKSFESDLVITDPELAAPIKTTIRVNHPYTYKGIAIYQSDFQDGGTKVNFKLWNLLATDGKAPVAQTLDGAIFSKGAIGGTGDDGFKIEYNDFRQFNILNLTPDGKGKPRNVGPNITYKLRDKQGQAREYVTYMQPMQLDGQYYFISGMRETVQDEFRYLRLPADEDGTLQGFMSFRAMMLDPAKQQEIAQHLAKSTLGADVNAAVKIQFEQSVVQLLKTFAQGGYTHLAEAIETRVPAAEREKAAQTYVKMINAAGFEAYNLGLQASKQAPLKLDTPKDNQNAKRLVQDSLNAFSDMFFYGSPYYLQLANYQHKQASGLQLTKSPGEKWVYFGSFLLVLGIFSMFYVRERRIWLLIKPQVKEGDEERQVLLAMSSNRKNLDFDQEFKLYSQQLENLLASE